MRTPIQILAIFTVMALSAFKGHANTAAVQSSTYDRIKAAYIYNFSKYIEVPVQDDKHIRVCSYAGDNMSGALESIRGRMSQGKEVKLLNPLTPDEARVCNIVFIGATEMRQAGAIYARNPAALIVTDGKVSSESMAHIFLIAGDDHVAFDVNLALMTKSNLKASSQMLRLARNVWR